MELIKLITSTQSKYFVAYIRTIEDHKVYIESLDLLINSVSVKGADWNQLSHLADGLVGRLVSNYLDQQPIPFESGTGLFMSAYGFIFAKTSGVSRSLVAERSVLLLLQLCNLQTDVNGTSFRLALGNSLGDSVSESPLTLSSHAPFRLMYEIIETKLEEDVEAAILLYFLMMRNIGFRLYLLSRSDSETMLLCILKALYQALENKRTYSLVYLLLDVLILLSSDDYYNNRMGKLVITTNLSWYTERILRDMTYGGLLVLIVLRILSNNLSKVHSLQLHLSCIALICNTATAIHNIRTVVAQKLINFFDIVAKRYLKLFDECINTHQEPTPLSHIYSDLVCMSLELFNVIISSNLRDNPHLVYTLLSRRKLFESFTKFSIFEPPATNILHVVDHFNALIESSNLESPTVDTLMAIIESGNQTWTTSKVVQLAAVKYQAEEDYQSHEFIRPLIELISRVEYEEGIS